MWARTLFGGSQFVSSRSSTGWLMISIFVLIAPYLNRSEEISLLSVGITLLTYVTLIIPLITGVLSRKAFASYISSIAKTALSLDFWKDVGCFTLFLADWGNFLYLQAVPAHPTVMQVMFNVAAEKIFCPEQRLCSLYVLLFYSVIAYLQRSLKTRPWTRIWSEQNTTIELVKLTTVFMIVRLGKAVVMTLVLLTISMQFRHTEPPVDYVAVTLLFFCLTQYRDSHTLVDSAKSWLTKLNLDWLEGMEELIAPFLLDAITLFMSVSVAAVCLGLHQNFYVIIILSYTNILVPLIQMEELTWLPLITEWRKIKRFPFAPWNHPEIRSGEVCAICLDKLVVLSSRVTPCKHVFHGKCLRRSIHYTPWCPLCKSPL